MRRRIIPFLICLLLILPIYGCSNSTNDDSTDSNIELNDQQDSITSVSTSETLTDDYIEYSEYLNLISDPPNDWCDNLELSEESESFVLESKPMYLKIIDNDGKRFIQPIVILRITNVSNLQLEWRWFYSGTDKHQNLKTTDSLNCLLQPGETVIKCLPIVDYYQDPILDFSRAVIEIEPYSITASAQYGKILCINVEFSDLEIPEIT